MKKQNIGLAAVAAIGVAIGAQDVFAQTADLSPSFDQVQGICAQSNVSADETLLMNLELSLQPVSNMALGDRGAVL